MDISWIPIPGSLGPGIDTLRSLTADSFDRLATAIEGLDHVENASTCAGRVAAKFSDLPQDDVRQIMETAAGLEVGRITLGLSPEAFVERLAPPDRADAGDLSEFKRRLTRLLSAHNLSVNGKALFLINQHQRVMVDARILSDVRPVFDQEVEEGIQAAVIMHTLKLEYSENGESRSFFVAVDDIDIEALRVACDRALAKQHFLKKKLGAEVRWVEPHFGERTNDLGATMT